MTVQHFYGAKHLRQRDLGIVILSDCPSVCPSVTRVLCDETKEHSANILIPHERTITFVF